MIKLLCVGLGGMGLSDRKQAEASGQFEITGGVDVMEDTRAEFEKETGRPTFDNLCEALDKVDAGAVLIATPDKYHAPFSIQAMEAGLDVICEKPMADSLEDGLRMHETARKNNRMLMINNQLRWHPPHHHAMRLIKEGTIGDVRSIELEMYVFSDVCMSGYRSRLPQLMLQDLGIHHLDLIRFLSGQDATSVYMKSWPSNEDAVDIKPTTSVYGTMDLTGPVTASYRSKMRAITDHTGYACRALITGSKGILHSSGEKLSFQTYSRYQAGKDPQNIEPQPPKHGSMTAYAHAMKTRQPALTDSGDNIKSLATLFAAIESAKTGNVVPIG